MSRRRANLKSLMTTRKSYLQKCRSLSLKGLKNILLVACHPPRQEQVLTNIPLKSHQQEQYRLHLLELRKYSRMAPTLEDT
jgi:hypothetical protein